MDNQRKKKPKVLRTVLFIAAVGAGLVIFNYPAIHKWFNHGFAIVYYNKGIDYDNGKGVKKDYKKADYWFHKSAMLGYRYAELDLGYNYEFGEGVARNYKKEIKWYRKAGMQKVPQAEYNLGLAYGIDGIGNIPKAIYWMQKAEVHHGFRRSAKSYIKLLEKYQALEFQNRMEKSNNEFMNKFLAAGG